MIQYCRHSPQGEGAAESIAPHQGRPVGPGHGLEDTPESGHSEFGGVLFAGQHFDAKAEPQVGDEIAE